MNKLVEEIDNLRKNLISRNKSEYLAEDNFLLLLLFSTPMLLF